MPQIASAYVRIRPKLDPFEHEALQIIADAARALADGLDAYLSKFPTHPALEEEPRHD